MGTCVHVQSIYTPAAGGVRSVGPGDLAESEGDDAIVMPGRGPGRAGFGGERGAGHAVRFPSGRTAGRVPAPRAADAGTDVV